MGQIEVEWWTGVNQDRPGMTGLIQDGPWMNGVIKDGPWMTGVNRMDQGKQESTRVVRDVMLYILLSSQGT